MDKHKCEHDWNLDEEQTENNGEEVIDYVPYWSCIKCGQTAIGDIHDLPT